MSELVVILNALILLGVVVSAILAVHCEKLLSSVIALGVTGIFAAAEFLLLHAPCPQPAVWYVRTGTGTLTAYTCLLEILRIPLQVILSTSTGKFPLCT